MKKIILNGTNNLRYIVGSMPMCYVLVNYAFPLEDAYTLMKFAPWYIDVIAFSFLCALGCIILTCIKCLVNDHMEDSDDWYEKHTR